MLVYIDVVISHARIHLLEIPKGTLLESFSWKPRVAYFEWKRRNKNGKNEEQKRRMIIDQTGI